jgi:hypothetical protein
VHTLETQRTQRSPYFMWKGSDAGKNIWPHRLHGTAFFSCMYVTWERMRTKCNSEQNRLKQVGEAAENDHLWWSFTFAL